MRTLNKVQLVRKVKRQGAHHGLVGVLLKLDEADPGDVLQVHVSVGAVGGISVEVRRSGWRGHPQRLVAVDLVGHHIVGLQQSLGGGGDDTDFNVSLFSLAEQQKASSGFVKNQTFL